MNLDPDQSVPTDTFEQFRDYPWATDEQFQAGLSHIGASVALDPDVELQARAYYFAKKTGGTQIDLAQYRRWQDPDKSPGQPQSYQHIVELILSGKPIPGIKEVPSTVLGRDQSSAARSSVRPKPWQQV